MPNFGHLSPAFIAAVDGTFIANIDKSNREMNTNLARIREFYAVR